MKLTEHQINYAFQRVAGIVNKALNEFKDQLLDEYRPVPKKDMDSAYAKIQNTYRMYENLVNTAATDLKDMLMFHDMKDVPAALAEFNITVRKLAPH